jgi:sugar transferase (PEP-CTERM/EpsH1 system associated)
MRILFLHSQVPYPLDTGAKIRTFQLLKHLGRRHEITLACYGAASDAAVLGEVRQITTEVVLLPGRTKGHVATALALARSMRSGLPLGVNKYVHRAAHHMVLRKSQEIPFAVVHVDQPHMSIIAPPLEYAPRVVHEHNIESQIAKRFYENERNAWLKRFMFEQYRRMEQFEGDLWRQADHIVTVSDQDREQVLAFAPEKEITVVENGVDLDYFAYTPHPQPTPHLVYTGSMDWLPNEDAVLYFTENIFPPIRERYPEALFTIVGRRPSEKVRRLAQTPGVRVAGTVEDVRPYYAQATALVVPLRIGGGSRLKILEAMSSGVPVISTTIGCEGLEVKEGEHLLIADDPRHFAQRTVELIHYEMLQKELSAKARTRVVQRYGWAAMAEKLADLYDALAGSKQRPAVIPAPLNNRET